MVGGQALTKQMNAAAETARAGVSAEVDLIAAKGLPQTGNATGWSRLMCMFPSADVLLNSLQVQHCFSGVLVPSKCSIVRP